MLTRHVQEIFPDGHLKIRPDSGSGGPLQQMMMVQPQPQKGAVQPFKPGPGKPIEEARWIGAVVVDVEPLRLDAPDVEEVTVTRNGSAVRPVGRALKPMTFTNGAGEQRAVHAGTVSFSVAAFEPGAAVVLQVSARGLEPIIYSFSDAELATLR